MDSKKKIAIVDYGMGNLRSVSKALESLGAHVYVGSDPNQLSRFGKLILPGVGAFGDAMIELKQRKLIAFMQEAVRNGRILFGICLGLQLLFESSEENPGVKGLGIWKGSVQSLSRRIRSKKLKVPHMGWNQVKILKRSAFTRNIPSNAFFYFVHSFFALPKDRKLIIGQTAYGTQIPAILGNGCVFASQFHPEKSQRYGLQILKNFIVMKV